MTQDLSEGEVALEEAKDQKTPLGPRHLHWVHRDGGGHWLVRGQKKTNLCGTVRCRKVYIASLMAYQEFTRRHQEFVLNAGESIGPHDIGGVTPVEGYREF